MKYHGGVAVPAEARALVGAPTAAPARKTIADKKRTDAWRLHHGVNVKCVTCLFCGVNELRFNDKNSWQACHIVPEKFAAHPSVMSVYNLVPACAACNGSMGTQNALDFLYENWKVASLKLVCTNIYTAISERNDVEHAFDGCMWKLVQKLFGSDEHSAGGGITCANEPEIYGLLTLHQSELLRKRMADHMQAAADLAAQAEKLMRNPFVPSKRARLFA